MLAKLCLICVAIDSVEINILIESDKMTSSNVFNMYRISALSG